MTRAVSQRDRLVILVLYLVGLVVASKLAIDSWVPPLNEHGIWFYSALAALLLGNLLVTPFFTKPADAISYGVAALVTMLAANVWGSAATTGFEKFTWSVAIAYVTLVLIAALLAIAIKDSTRPFWQRVDRSCFILADALGAPTAVFSVVFLFALITYHRTTPREYVTIGLAWAVFVGLRPLEGGADLLRRWRVVWSRKADHARLGEVVAHETPGIVLIREDSATTMSLGDLVLARTERGEVGIAVALDHVGFAEGCWSRAYYLSHADTAATVAAEAGLVGAVSNGWVFRLDGEAHDGPLRDAQDARARLLGIVGANTNVGHLQIELVRSDLHLRQGSLVEVPVGSKAVLYQIIEGTTTEEIIQQKNTRGFVRAEAKKIGCWNAARRSFDPVPWLPAPNQPVLLVTEQACAAENEAVGHFPGTSYPVRIDPHLLVTHNAAILGILGVGKSFLALELVERMISAGIKVICLDLTDQYATELAPFFDHAAEQTSLDELTAVGPPGRTKCTQNVEEGGSVREFTAKVTEQLTTFLDAGDPRRVKIFNPVRFEVWQQVSKPFSGVASMATLTPTEVTRIITEVALSVLQSQGMADRARCCVVYEEAHSLIPEWNAVASDGDRTATNGTAKAILQGRKFGLGCLVVTQRTANVTKSILNQCNTVFGMRVYDATGMDFLKNYFGDEYADVLSTLEDRHVVVFGRASSCRDPVLIRLNDRDQFIQTFRPNAAAPAGGAVA